MRISVILFIDSLDLILFCQTKVLLRYSSIVQGFLVSTDMLSIPGYIVGMWACVLHSKFSFYYCLNVFSFKVYRIRVFCVSHIPIGFTHSHFLDYSRHTLMLCYTDSMSFLKKLLGPSKSKDTASGVEQNKQEDDAKKKKFLRCLALVIMIQQSPNNSTNGFLF